MYYSQFDGDYVLVTPHPSSKITQTPCEGSRVTFSASLERLRIRLVELSGSALEKVLSVVVRKSGEQGVKIFIMNSTRGVILVGYPKTTFIKSTLSFILIQLVYLILFE